MQHLEELRNKATEIATETQAGANTASRIGTAFTSVVDTIDELVNSEENVLQADVKQSEKITTLETTLTELKQQLNGVNSELITSLQERINTLIGANANEVIDSFNEVITFLGGVRNSDTLNALLAKINERLSTLETTKVTTLENSVSSLRDDLTSETTNRTQSISGLDGKLTTLQGKLTEETSARETAVSGVNSTIETLRSSISTAITELKNKKVIAEDVTTTENGDTKELTLQAGKVYMLSENVDKLRIKAIAPPENAKEVAEMMLYFHTGQNGDSGVVARSGDAPMISFEGVALPKDMTIEKNMFYEISFKYNPIARKYTALVASWAIA